MVKLRPGLSSSAKTVLSKLIFLDVLTSNRFSIKAVILSMDQYLARGSVSWI